MELKITNKSNGEEFESVGCDWRIVRNGNSMTFYATPTDRFRIIAFKTILSSKVINGKLYMEIY